MVVMERPAPGSHPLLGGGPGILAAPSTLCPAQSCARVQQGREGGRQGGLGGGVRMGLGCPRVALGPPPVSGAVRFPAATVTPAPKSQRLRTLHPPGKGQGWLGRPCPREGQHPRHPGEHPHEAPPREQPVGVKLTLMKPFRGCWAAAWTPSAHLPRPPPEPDPDPSQPPAPCPMATPGLGAFRTPQSWWNREKTGEKGLGGVRAGCREPVGAPARCSPRAPDEGSSGQGPQSHPQHCRLLPAAAPASCSAQRCPQPAASPKSCAAWAGGEAAATRCALPTCPRVPVPARGRYLGHSLTASRASRATQSRARSSPARTVNTRRWESAAGTGGGVPSVPGAGDRLEGLWGASSSGSLPRACSRSVALVWGQCLAPHGTPWLGGHSAARHGGDLMGTLLLACPCPFCCPRWDRLAQCCVPPR